ncbi:MAG: hypothetical protein A9Z00_09055 [Thermobacillus sp. ZCTH02-B1]|nr:MAG: hypothetical protein A9Z00_09055 [Thermobacillus sp. ZCTH02-B1]
MKANLRDMERDGAPREMPGVRRRAGAVPGGSGAAHLPRGSKRDKLPRADEHFRRNVKGAT